VFVCFHELALTFSKIAQGVQSKQRTMLFTLTT
jgi:hypothetical protein